MASSMSYSESVVVERERHFARVHKYRWPAVQLNVWIVVMLAAAGTMLGIAATFVQTQNRLLLDVPWYFPYWIATASLAMAFVLAVLWLIFQRRLLPSIVMVAGFALFVLWTVGLVVWSIELWGPAGNVSANCNLAVFRLNPHGQSLATLAWLEQRSICQSWQAGFGMGLVGDVFLFWIMVMAYQVFVDDA